MSDLGSDGLSQKPQPFEFGVRLGIVLIVEAACLSALAVTSLLVYFLYSFATLKRGAPRTWTVSTHIHYYFINLLVSDLIQAIGGIIDIKWALEAVVTEGTACTVQGIFKQMGDVGVAFTSLTIAIHTFSVLVVRRTSGPRTALFVIATIWIFISLAIGISMALHKGKDYYGNTQYWCWITSDFNGERIGLEYAWMWIAAFVNLFCYIAIALVIKGVMIIDGTKVRFRSRKGSTDRSEQYGLRSLHHHGEHNAIAMQMLFYPLIYLITVFPITVVRWLAFGGHIVPFSVTAFAAILFSSSGLLNVLLFVLTRPRLLPNRRKSISTQSSYPLSTVLWSPQMPTPTQNFPSPSEHLMWKDSPEMAPAQLPILHIKTTHGGSTHPRPSSNNTV